MTAGLRQRRNPALPDGRAGSQRDVFPRAGHLIRGVQQAGTVLSPKLNPPVTGPSAGDGLEEHFFLRCAHRERLNLQIAQQRYEPCSGIVRSYSNSGRLLKAPKWADVSLTSENHFAIQNCAGQTPSIVCFTCLYREYRQMWQSPSTFQIIRYSEHMLYETFGS